jgi:hypothetical protein
MQFCLAGDTGIEPILRESKSRVLPLHQSPTKSRIFKEQGRILSYVDIIVNPLKQKTLWIFISEGLGSNLFTLQVTCQTPYIDSQ